MINPKRAERYCSESIENIENYREAVQSEKPYDCHHRNEIALQMRRGDLIKNNLYYNRPAAELLFIERIEHIKLHNIGKTLSEDTRKKLAATKTKYHIDEEELRRLRVNKKYTLDQCAEYFGTSRMTMSRAVRKLNL